MKGISAILVLLAAGMLVFGCTYSTQNSVNYSAGNSNDSAGASGGTQNPSGGANSGAAQPSGTSGGTGPSTAGAGTSGTGTPAATEPGNTPSPDLSGKIYSDLIGSGTASQCTVSYTSEADGAVVLKIYFDGKNNMRIEQPTGYPDCPSAVMVYKGDSSGNGMLYLSCPGHNEEALGQKFGTHEQCVWQTMEIEEQWGGIGTSSRGIENGYSTPSLEYLPSPVYNCQSWTLDNSKFDTSGFVCD